jgi:hypothetical protein
MGKAKRRRQQKLTYSKLEHPKVTQWIQQNLYPYFSQPGILVTFDDSLPLRVFRVPCAIPTRDEEIVDGKAKFSKNLLSYQDDERLLCYLKIEAAHHIYLIENHEQMFEPDEPLYFSLLRNVAEVEFNWSRFFSIACKSEGYYRIDHSNGKAQSLGSTWDEATANLIKMGHALENIPS